MNCHTNNRDFNEELRVLVASTSPDRPLVERIGIVMHAILLTLERQGIGTNTELASIRAMLDRV